MAASGESKPNLRDSNEDQKPEIAAMEPLEGRVFLSASAPAGSWDAGDYYWSSDQKYPLLRATDEMVVGFEHTKGAPRLARELIAEDGPLRGFKFSQWLGSGIANFKRKTPLTVAKFRATRRKTDAAPGVSWASPGFVSVGQGGPFRMSVVNSLYVTLDGTVDPAEVFAKGFTGYSGGEDNHYTVNMVKGGVMALRSGNWLKEHVPGVIQASADHWSTVILL